MYKILVATISVMMLTGVASATGHIYPNSWMGPTGLFSIISADSLPHGDFSLSLYFNNWDRSAPDSYEDYSYDLTYLSVPIAFGLFDRLELSIAPNYHSFRNEYIQGDNSSNEGLGDVFLNAKVAILKENSAPGLGVLVFGKLPTADEDEGLGTGEADYGIKLLLSKHLSTVGLHLNAGYTVIGDPDYYDLDDVVNYGVGVNLPLDKKFQFIGELTGETVSNSDAMDDPLDLTLGGRYIADNGLSMGFGVRYNLMMEMDSCPVGGVFHIGYTRGLVQAPVPTPVPNRPPILSCAIESEQVILGQYTRITAEASDPDGDTITYSWQTTGCKLVGSGSEVKFYAEDCPPGRYTITVTVQDSRGATAVCSVMANVVKKTETERVTLDLPHVPFKKGTRVDNVAKAILDDIALNIKRYPEAPVTLVGHSDSQGSEQANYKIGLERAQNVKKYLVDRHNINPDRITVESKGETQPIADNNTAAGRAKNRRVEVIMVVERTVE